MAKRNKKDSVVTDNEQRTTTDRPVAPKAPIDERRIRERAYELYLERGDRPGDDLDDWLRAEREFRQTSQGSDSREA